LGGQIASFGHALDLPPGSGAYNRDWYDTRYGKLYVSRGIGVGVVPMRIGSAPELPAFEVGLN
jgi:predicted MPP superfamily phosphohydrolase